MKFLMPAWTISPTQDRSSADSSRNQSISLCIRATAVVLSEPIDRCRAAAARARDEGRASADT